MRLFRLASLLLCGLLIPSSIAAQQPPVCNVTCEPNPQSSTYIGGTIQARPQSANLRGASSVLAPTAAGGAAESAVVAGSQSYSYAIPILSLTGRNGLDLNLTLYYNSRVWTIDSANSKATFNADRDFPSYGFRLGFGYIENNASSNTFILTEADGTKRNLNLISGTTYQPSDSSYLDFNSATKILRRKGGTQWEYEQVGSSTIYRPIKIKDTNGNSIAMSYSTATGVSNQAIGTITDTLGRQITFNYDTSGKLTTISAPALGGVGTRTVASFAWGQVPLNYSFTLSTPDTVSNGTLINGLTGCSYTNGTGYSFTYGDWGILTQIAQKSSTNQTRSYVRYDYPLATTALSDHPTFQHQIVSTDGTAGGEGSWSYSVTTSGGLVSATAITDPFGTVTTTNWAAVQSGIQLHHQRQCERGPRVRLLLRSETQEAD